MDQARLGLPDADLEREDVRLRIIVDHAKCNGHARCQATAPDLFDTDDLGFVVLLASGTVEPSREEAARVAVRNCPEQALTVEQ